MTRTSPVGQRAAHPDRDVTVAPLLRHLAVAALAALLLLGFWFSRMEWAPDMRLWRAVGDVAVVLLFVSLALGPAVRLYRPLGRLLPWRRQVGIWAGLTAVAHSLLVINGWAQWSVQRFLGYEFIPELGRQVRLEPGFGLANIIGLVALAWMLVLLATSSDRAVRFLGPGAWKWLHSGAYVVFYLVVLHAAYFLFMHYLLSFHRAPAPENWFRFPLLALGVTVVTLQAAAFAQSVRRRRSRPDEGLRAQAHRAARPAGRPRGR